MDDVQAQIEGNYLSWKRWWASRWPLIVHKKRADVLVAVWVITVLVAFSVGAMVR